MNELNVNDSEISMNSKRDGFFYQRQVSLL